MCIFLKTSSRVSSILHILATSFSIFILFGNPGTDARSRCSSLNNSAGTCIPLKNCPSLLEMISGDNITSESIRQLQQLTCGFDKNEPRVCCAIEKTTANNSSKLNPNLTLRKLEDHRNFKLLPKVGICGKINVKTGNRIIGGSIPPLGSQPWLARVGYTGSNGETSFYCGGSLISNRYVLTAAHCVVGDDDSKLASVRLGEYDTENDPDCSPETGKCSYINDVKIDKVISHHKYNSDAKQHDIALIRLAEDVFIDTEFIKPVCLPGQNEFKAEFDEIGINQDLTRDVTYGSVAGWGSVKWNVLRETPVVRTVSLPIVPNSKCHDIYVGRTTISNTQMCAGGEAGKDSCDGDSGGPLVYYLDNAQHYFQIGIVSFGPTRCGSGGLPGIYTRISEYLEWILDNIEP